MFIHKIQNKIGHYLIRKIAKSQGFLDPINVISKLNRFSQPSEIAVPTELLRAGALFQARGLLNTQAIQHNLDWIWPYWVERQFNPKDKAFIPRAFQLTHVNLTNRNWTAVGLPVSDELPIIDPKGLLTPFWDGWSVDVGFVTDKGTLISPSKNENTHQELSFQDNLQVLTTIFNKDMNLKTAISVEREDDSAVCVNKISLYGKESGWMIISLRPFNPEGVSFINSVRSLAQNTGWNVNDKQDVLFDSSAQTIQYSQYFEGDVLQKITPGDSQKNITCPVGMATAAALFRVEAEHKREVSLKIPLEKIRMLQGTKKSSSQWGNYLNKGSQIHIPDAQMQYLFNSSKITLLLHTSHDSYAGPYTYKRFWFRDACFIAHALTVCGFLERAKNIIDTFPQRQTPTGYFNSQEGEWDSNGQVLWVLKHFYELSNQKPSKHWSKIIQKAAKWIIQKRLSRTKDTIHAGLMPAGFSAEHLGPSDFYYWDNFWSVSGLHAAAYLMREVGENQLAQTYENEATDLMQRIEKSLKQVQARLKRPAVPASPYRRLDSGAVGSLAVNYPLQLWDSHDPRIIDTVEYLLKNSIVLGGFFHDMSHSGINPYLTLHIAQILLQAGDKRYWDLFKAVGDLASSTGLWPEAVHPQTRGGCMGDGQHVWAAAEWLIMTRNCFVREDTHSDTLILLNGIPSEWYQIPNTISFGPTRTRFGPITLYLNSDEKNLKIHWEADWFGKEPKIRIDLPDRNSIHVEPNQSSATISKTQT
jgi:hypothetical protein